MTQRPQPGQLHVPEKDASFPPATVIVVVCVPDGAENVSSLVEQKSSLMSSRAWSATETSPGQAMAALNSSSVLEPVASHGASPLTVTSTCSLPAVANHSPPSAASPDFSPYRAPKKLTLDKTVAKWVTVQVFHRMWGRRPRTFSIRVRYRYRAQPMTTGDVSGTISG